MRDNYQTTLMVDLIDYFKNISGIYLIFQKQTNNM